MEKKREMPLLILKGLVILPKSLLHIDIKHELSVMAVEQAMAEDQLVFLLTQKNGRKEEPDLSEDVYRIGTIARIKQIVRLPKNSLSVVVEGLSRGRLDSYERLDNFYRATVEHLPEVPAEISMEEKEAYFRQTQKAVAEYVEMSGKMDKQLAERVLSVDTLSDLADGIAAYLLRPMGKKQEILEEPSEEERIKKIIQILLTEMEIIRLQR